MPSVLSVFKNRVSSLLRELERLNLDSLLVTELTNVRYLSGFTGSNAYMLVTLSGASYLFTDFRYKEQVREELKGSSIKVRMIGASVNEVASFVASNGGVSIGFEGSLRYDLFKRFRAALKGKKFKASSGIVEALRIIKDPTEVAAIRDAVTVAEKGFKALKRRTFKGRSEKDIATRLEYDFKKFGASGVSFDTIVASGPRAALPHAKPSNKFVRSSELVVVDAGVELGGYKSDQTRTFSTGRLSALQKKVYSIVKDAHDLAIEEVMPGAHILDVDRAAREYIKNSGYGKFFGHGTGHGVGLDVHELPWVGPRSKGRLKEGMVFTIEPGIYLPGEVGVRLEDMILVTGDGAELLTDGQIDMTRVA